MKIVADENISAVLVKELRQAGYEVVYIRETASGSADPDILDLSTTTGSLLVTDDRDYGELVFRKRQRTSGVVYLRLEGLSQIQRAQKLIALLQEHRENLLGMFTVVTPRNVRMRSPDTDEAI